MFGAFSFDFCTPISPSSPSLPKKVVLSFSLGVVSFTFLLPKRLPADDGLEEASLSLRKNGGVISSMKRLEMLDVLVLGIDVAAASPPNDPELLMGGVGGSDPPTTVTYGVTFRGGGKLLSASCRFPVSERRSKSDSFGNGSGWRVYDAVVSEVADEFAVTYSLVDVLGREDV